MGEVRSQRVVPVTAGAAARRLGVLSPTAAAALGGAVLVLAAASVPLAGLARQLTTPAETATVIYVLACAAVGVVVARHQPGNSLGWLLLFFALLLMLSVDAGYYAVFCYNLGHRGMPLGAVAVLLVPLWALAAVLFSLVILLFPDGRVPSRRWRWVLWVYVGLVACYLTFSYSRTVAAVAGQRVRLDSSGDVLSTQHFPGWFVVLVLIPITVLWLAFAVHQVLSWRRAAGERRQQLKWLASGVVVALGVGAVASSLVPGAAGQALSVALVALPASIGVGIQKYRLYEIDRIISRTLAYAIVTGLLIGVYAGLVLLATSVLGVTSPVAVAASTLAAAALFNPLRHQVQRRVDRRFNQARYDADQTVAAFASRLKDAVDLDMVATDLAGVVRQVLEPTHVTISIKPVGWGSSARTDVTGD